MSEKLYLQERQDIIGAHANRARFADVLVQYGNGQPTDSPWQQIGAWVLVGMTGRWQRTMALWEWANGWDGFSSMIESTMIQAPQDLAGVYRDVEGLRSGGECFVMEPGPGCPALDEMIGRGVTGSLLAYERARVHPGSEAEYLSVVQRQWAPVTEQYGYAMVGNYVAAKVDGLVFTLWACERDAHTELARSHEARQWRDARRQLTLGWEEEIWICAAGSRLAGPETAASF